MKKAEHPSIVYESGALFEKDTAVRKYVYRFILQPILNILPGRSQKYVKRTDKMAADVVEHRTSHNALEILYTGGYPERVRTVPQKLAYRLWMNTDNVLGVRNRLRLVEREMRSVLADKATDEKVRSLRLLSIASGSARSFLELLSPYAGAKHVPIAVTFLDKNPAALQYSRELVATLPPDECITYEWVEGTANGYLNGLRPEESYDLIEMVGLMDYFDDDKAVQTMKSIGAHLNVGGSLLTANVLPNPEQRFLTNVINWRMIYREAEPFVQLAVRAGFRVEDIRAFIEPQQVHVVLHAKKYV